MDANLDALDALVENGSMHKRRMSVAAIVWIFLAIAALALGAGLALMPGIAERIQL